MKLSKKIINYAKYVQYNLPWRSKPVKVPHSSLEWMKKNQDQIPFSGVWLIQILLNKHHIADKEIKEQGFQSYGWCGGTSGFNNEDLAKLNKIFKFKGMGNAEYETGELGKSWNFLKKNYNSFLFKKFNVFNKDFYVVCLSYHEEYIEKALTALIANNQFPVRISKQELQLHKVIQDQDKNFIGGWQFDSHFLFFTNKNKYEKFLKLLREEANKG